MYSSWEARAKCRASLDCSVVLLGSPLLDVLPHDSELDFPPPSHDQRSLEPSRRVGHCWPLSVRLMEAEIRLCLLSGLAAVGYPDIG